MKLEKRLPNTVTKSSGFSLLEILVAMAIMAILGGIMVGTLIGETEKAKFERIRADLRVMETSLERYYADNFLLPTTDQGLESLVSIPTEEPIPKSYSRRGYIKNLQSDPWGNPYQYTYPGENGNEYDIYSLGADGEEGGEGLNADIGNWNIDEAIRSLTEQS